MTNLKKQLLPIQKTPRVGQPWPRPKLALNLKRVIQSFHQAEKAVGTEKNAKKNTRDSAASSKKYYKGDIEVFRAVIMMKYEKVELKKSFDVFKETL